ERGFGAEVGIVAQRLRLAELRLELLQLLPELDDRRDVRALLHHVLEPGRILEHGRIHQLRVELLDARFDVLELTEHGAMLSLFIAAIVAAERRDSPRRAFGSGLFAALD